MRAIVDKAQILQLVFAAVDEVNKQLRKAQRLEKSPETVIAGNGAQLDSLGLVNLIVAAEEQIEQRHGTTIILAEESALSQDQSPFRTLGSLAEHIQMLLEKRWHG